MKQIKRMLSLLLAFVMLIGMIPTHVHAAEADATLTASLQKAKSYIDGITINNSSNDPATVVKNFKTHFTWDNEKRENSKSYLFDWSYYNGVVFEGIEYVYEVTGESVYRDYVVEYMSSMITSSGGWATCSNNTSKQAAGYNSTHGADCYKTASLLMDCYQMTGDSRYLTMAKTLYADLDSAAGKYSLANAGKNFRHTWSSDPSPDLWLDGLYMILPFRAEYAKHIGDQEELDLIVSRMQWVSDNMYNASRKLFYHAADSASSNSGTYWLRSIGWYAAAIVDIMDSMQGSNLEAMKTQLKKLVDGMKACQNTSNGMWLNNMNAGQSSSNPYETSGTALVCYAVMKAVNNGWLDESYADMAILAFNGICSEKLSGSTLKDICFKGVPSGSNSTFYDNEGKGVGPFIMLYAEILEYVNKAQEEPEVPETTVPEVTEPEATEPEVTEPEVTEPEVTEPEATEPKEEVPVYTGTSNLIGNVVYTLDTDGINNGEKYIIVYSGKALQNNNGADGNPSVTVSNNTISLSDDSKLAWTITQYSGSNYYVENNGSYLNLKSSGNDPIGSQATVYISRSSSKYTFRNASGSGAYLRYSSSQLFCAGTNNSNNGMYLYRRSSTGNGDQVIFTLTPNTNVVKPGSSLALNGTVTVAGKAVDLNSCTISWSSANSNCAAVSNGVVTGVAAGQTNVTATLTAVNGKSLTNSIVLIVPITVQGHDYKSVITAPTCTEKGYTTYTCTICGDSYVADEVAALGHNYLDVTTAATCTEDGAVVFTCDCGDTYTEVIPAVGHDYKTVITKPTCTEDGYTTYTCACGDSYVADEIGALGHDIESVVTTPTCIAEGYTTHTCLRCGEATVDSVVAALGHTYEAMITNPTCTKQGSIVYTCHCGETYTEVIPAFGHNYKAVVTAPTCEDDGYTTYTCACGHSYIANQVAALGHNIESVVTEATCETVGYTTHTCHVCGKVTVDNYVEALGHDYMTVVLDPTCTEAGSVTKTCGRCGDSHTEEIAALGHDYEAVVTAPACCTNGYTTYTCHCGDSYVADEVTALGHVYVSVTTAATCTQDGSVVFTCNCGDTYTEVVPATGHNHQTVVTAPTCTEKGFTTYTCHCGDSYVADEVAALGHKYDAVVTAPTCEDDGYTTYTCHCGDSYVADEVAALGHKYDAVVTVPTCEDDGYTTYTCHCGDSYVADEVAALGHKYDAIVTAPTCEDDGYTTYTCDCGNSYVADEVAALGHNYEVVTTDATCTEEGSIVHTCHCGDVYTEVIKALGHKYDAVVTVPTCEDAGYTTYTCHCGDSYVADEVAALGHDYEVVTNEATCTEDGSIVYTCYCGDAYTEIIPALGHEYKSVTTKATCTQDGSVVFTCRCGDTYTEIIPALGHQYEAKITAPTCETEGYTTYTCACGDSYIADEVAALGHKYDAVVTAPTCEDAGYTTYTCHCGDSYIADEVAALGHDYEVVTNEATCTQDGSVVYTCRCGATYSEVIKAPGHKYETKVTAPTCENEGYTTYTCHCGENYTANQTAALGHSYTTAEQNGILIHTCGNCGHSYTESVAWIAVGSGYVLDTDGIDVGSEHKYIVVGATRDYALTVNGSSVSATAVTISNNTLIVDDTSKMELWFANNSSRERNTYLLTQDGSKGVYHVSGNINYGHDSKGYWYFGSSSNGLYQLYDKDGQSWYLNYGYVWSNQSANRFAVSSQPQSVRLFKKTDGYARLTGELIQTVADTDNASLDALLNKVSIQLSANGTDVTGTAGVTADMLSWNNPFDSTMPGVYTADVTYQGVKLGTVTVTVTSNHNYVTSVIAPTCESQGYTERKCTECGVTNKVDYTAALGHSYTYTDANGYRTYSCQYCDHSYSEKLSFTYGKVNTFTSGERFVITVKSGSKYYALSHSGNKISAVQVSVSNDKITSEISEDLLWSYNNGKLSYESGGKTYYLYTYSSGWWWTTTYLGISTNDSGSISLSSGKLKIDSTYLRYSSSNFSVSSSGSTVSLFQEN